MDKMLDFNTVRTELGVLNLRLSPTQRSSPDELDLQSKLILEDLSGWRISRFKIACVTHRMRSNFLPTSADLLKAYRDAPEENDIFPPLPAAENYTTAQILKNKQRAHDLVNFVKTGKRPSWVPRAR